MNQYLFFKKNLLNYRYFKQLFKKIQKTIFLYCLTNKKIQTIQIQKEFVLYCLRQYNDTNDTNDTTIRIV